MPLRVLRFVHRLGKFDRRSQFRSGSDACRIVAPVMNWSSNLRRGANRHAAPPGLDLSLDGPRNDGLVIENHKIAPEVAIHAHALSERSQAAANFSRRIQIHNFIEGKEVLSYASCNGHVICSRPDVPIDLPADARRARENNGVTLDMSADFNTLPKEKEVPLHRTVNPPSRTGNKEVTLNGFVLGEFIGAFGLVKLRGTRGRRQNQRGTQSR